MGLTSERKVEVLVVTLVELQRGQRECLVWAVTVFDVISAS